MTGVPLGSFFKWSIVILQAKSGKKEWTGRGEIPKILAKPFLPEGASTSAGELDAKSF